MINGEYLPEEVNNITIHLTQEEAHLFSTLERAAEAYETGAIQLSPDLCTTINNNRQQHIEIRIAGGWVRDKILQQDSHDIDVALDCMSGRAFATILQTYFMSINSTPAMMSPAPKIAIISANPAQSKHLETATMKIYGMDIDFVNLRAEEIYQPDSRIPHRTQFGTPKEDALRRDFTVNSLFYNIRTRAMEDWTGRGVQDLLLNKMLVTPLSAQLTLLEDPLRVLRAIRFSVRYNLSLHADILEAATSDQVHKALHLKVSRERVGKELDDMLVGKGAKPGKALCLLTHLKLAGSVFCFPIDDTGLLQTRGEVMGVNYGELYSVEEKARAREMAWLESTKLIQILPHVFQCFQNDLADKLLLDDLTQADTRSTYDERLVYLSTFLSPLRNLTNIDNKKKEVSLISYIVRESIKFKNKDITDVSTILGNINEMQSFIEKFRNHHHHNEINDVVQFSLDERLEIGLLLRKVKDVWVSLLVVSIALVTRKYEASQLESAIFRHLCCHLYRCIVHNDLDRCWTIRPLIDGRDLIELLGITTGPQVALFLDEEVKWMLVNPDGTRQDCELYLKEKLMTLT